MAEHLKEFDGKEFQDVGRGNFSLPKADEKDQDAVNKRHKSFIAKLEENLKDRVEKINVSQRLVESAACVVPGDNDLPPQMKRMLEASGQKLPETKPILEINMKHDLMKKLNKLEDEAAFSNLASTILDHALLSDGEQLQNPADYVKRISNLLINSLDAKSSANKKTKKKVAKKEGKKK